MMSSSDFSVNRVKLDWRVHKYQVMVTVAVKMVMVNIAMVKMVMVKMVMVMVMVMMSMGESTQVSGDHSKMPIMKSDEKEEVKVKVILQKGKMKVKVIVQKAQMSDDLKLIFSKIGKQHSFS